jgi:hypothetical protein
MLLRWLPVDGAQRYRVEISRSNSFLRTLEVIQTQTTAWAPLLVHREFAKRGLFYWRVASMDAGNNLGGWRTGTFAIGKALEIRVTGEARAGVRSPLRVTVVNQAGKRVAGAKVRVSGLGASARGRTNRKGRTTLRVRASRRGTLTFTARKRGYAHAEFSLQVR